MAILHSKCRPYGTGQGGWSKQRLGLLLFDEKRLLVSCVRIKL